MLCFALSRVLRLAPVVALACSSSDDSRPPAFGGDLSEEVSAVACWTLRSDGPKLSGSTLLVKDEPAPCAADGMQCPLEQTEELTVDCESGQQAHAFCERSIWRLRCVFFPDGHAGDTGAVQAGGAGGAAGAPASSAGTDHPG